MKTKVTRKMLENNYSIIYKCGYCDLEPLYHYNDALYYNNGVYGWNYDVFTFSNIIIVSGYRGMFGKELPQKCKDILKKANEWYKEQVFSADLDSFRKEFEAALREG